MKKILVTGAAGIIGVKVIEKLLDADKYEITALDLKNSRSVKKLKKFNNKINILYGDISDIQLMDALIRDHDAIIHLAGVIPPFADIKPSLVKLVDYEGIKVIINAINDFNPSCFLLFASTTTLYGENITGKNLSVRNKIEINVADHYSMAKLRCEEKIKEKVTYYTIFRLPAVLGHLKYDSPMYNIPANSKVEFITANDAALAFVNALEKKSKLNKKTFNITGGESCRTTFKSFLHQVLSIYGISFRYIITSLLVDKNFYSGYYSDSDIANEILNFRQNSLKEYFKNIKTDYGGKRRIIPRILAKPFLIKFKHK